MAVMTLFCWISFALLGVAQEGLVINPFLGKGKKSALPHYMPTNAKSSIGSIAVMVTSKDRIGYVMLCAKALQGTISTTDIYVFDDGSTQFTHDDLKKWFGPNVFKSPRLGPDANTVSSLHVVFKRGYDYVVNLDSDLILNPHWMTRFRAVIAQQRAKEVEIGLNRSIRDKRRWWSFYHSQHPHHKLLHGTNCSADLCRMDSLGFAGTIWSKDFFNEAMQHTADRRGEKCRFTSDHALAACYGTRDWAISSYCRAKGIPMIVFRQSQILHVGLFGFHGKGTGNAEIASGFQMEELEPGIANIAQRFLEGSKPNARVEVSFSSSDR
jgi:hypothetical protein